MDKKIKALDEFKYTNKEGKTAYHLKQLPRESKITLIKIFDNINKKAKNE